MNSDHIPPRHSCTHKGYKYKLQTIRLRKREQTGIAINIVVVLQSLHHVHRQIIMGVIMVMWSHLPHTMHDSWLFICQNNSFICYFYIWNASIWHKKYVTKTWQFFLCIHKHSTFEWSCMCYPVRKGFAQWDKGNLLYVLHSQVCVKLVELAANFKPLMP